MKRGSRPPTGLGRDGQPASRDWPGTPGPFETGGAAPRAGGVENGRDTATKDIEQVEEPEIAKRIFASKAAAVGWLFARLYIGWEFFAAGWGKEFGGTITCRFWNWAEWAYSAARATLLDPHRRRGTRTDHVILRRYLTS